MCVACLRSNVSNVCCCMVCVVVLLSFGCVLIGVSVWCYVLLCLWVCVRV